uniref:Uncharacterized protein n=1 Tax=Anguilla anguilla TaxID=7936 RepID=A0A0E9WH12_ANGAN
MHTTENIYTLKPDGKRRMYRLYKLHARQSLQQRSSARQQDVFSSLLVPVSAQPTLRGTRRHRSESSNDGNNSPTIKK